MHERSNLVSLTGIAEGSLVSTPRGPIPIERLRLGDELHSVAPETGDLAVVRLVALREATRECVELQLSDREWLGCTPDHPLYDPDLRDYRPAGDWVLRRARRLMTRTSGGLEARTTSMALAYVGLAQVFDLTVDGPHHSFLADRILVQIKTAPA